MAGRAATKRKYEHNNEKKHARKKVKLVEHKEFFLLILTEKTANDLENKKTTLTLESPSKQEKHFQKIKHVEQEGNEDKFEIWHCEIETRPTEILRNVPKFFGWSSSKTNINLVRNENDLIYFMEDQNETNEDDRVIAMSEVTINYLIKSDDVPLSEISKYFGQIMEKLKRIKVIRAHHRCQARFVQLIKLITSNEPYVKEGKSQDLRANKLTLLLLHLKDILPKFRNSENIHPPEMELAIKICINFLQKLNDDTKRILEAHSKHWKEDFVQLVLFLLELNALPRTSSHAGEDVVCPSKNIEFIFSFAFFFVVHDSFPFPNFVLPEQLPTFTDFKRASDFAKYLNYQQKIRLFEIVLSNFIRNDCKEIHSLVAFSYEFYFDVFTPRTVNLIELFVGKWFKCSGSLQELITHVYMQPPNISFPSGTLGPRSNFNSFLLSEFILQFLQKSEGCLCVTDYAYFFDFFYKKNRIEFLPNSTWRQRIEKTIRENPILRIELYEAPGDPMQS